MQIQRQRHPIDEVSILDYITSILKSEGFDDITPTPLANKHRLAAVTFCCPKRHYYVAIIQINNLSTEIIYEDNVRSPALSLADPDFETRFLQQLQECKDG